MSENRIVTENRNLQQQGAYCPHLEEFGVRDREEGSKKNVVFSRYCIGDSTYYHCHELSLFCGLYL